MQTDTGRTYSTDTLLKFIDAKVNTFVKWDLVRFFHDNPHVANTAQNIAAFAGRDVDRVEVELRDLVARGVLNVKNTGETSVYRLVNDPEMRAIIDQFIRACDDRAFRVRAINRVIEGLRHT